MLEHVLRAIACSAVVCTTAIGEQDEPRQLPPEGQVLRVEACCAAVGGELKVTFGAASRKGVTLSVRCEDMPKLNHHWGMGKLEQELEDAALVMRLTGNHEWERRQIQRAYFIRPDVHFYVKADLEKALQRWPELPPASEHRFRLDFTRTRGRVEISMDGRYFTSFPAPSSDDVRLSVKNGAEVESVTALAAPETDRYVPVDLSQTSHRGDLQIEGLPLEPGARNVGGIPMNVAPSDAEVDVGLSRWLRQKTGASTFYDPYYRRTAWDGVPETIMFSVPRRFYNYAHVLCAVEDRGDESPSMSLRLARYRQAWDGGGGTQADTTVVLDPGDPQGCTSLRKIGTVRASVEGQARDLTLYLVEIPLKTGELVDCLRRTEMTGYDTPDFFYLELTRELRTRVMVNYAYYEKKPLGPVSGVHVLGLTLEKAPAEILVKSEAIGNALYVDEDPRLEIQVNNPASSEAHLRMESCLTDFFGVQQKKQRELKLAPGPAGLSCSLEDLAPGWYRARFTFSTGSRVLWEQPLTLSLLPPDTRKAGAESPYGIWWFGRAHYGEPQADKVLPLLQKMGFRHVTAKDHNPKYGHTPETFARYQVTPSMMRRMTERKKSPPVEEQARKFMTDWPDTRHAMIFHETGGLPFGLEPPPELMGQEPTEFTGKDLEREKELYEHIERHAAAIRQAAPKAKIILGNSGTNFNVHWLRKRLPRKYWDYIGMEMAVQLFAPESQPHGWNLQGLWMAKKMCEIYGYKDVPITTCYEFDYRTTAPGALSLQEQANWYTRDVLHCLAYGLPNINVGLICDTDSAYYFSRWGGTGVCFRAPLMMPKPSYVALATLTRVLDRARYRRCLDTGSHSLYCLEFERGDEFAYALWTPTGQREVTATLRERARGCTLVNAMGRETSPSVQGSTLQMRASESPCYLVTEQPLARVVAGRSHHDAPKLEGRQVVDKLAASDWRIVDEVDEEFQNYCPYKPLAQAQCAISPGENGALKLTLHSQPDVPDIVGRYAILEPKSGPIPVEGAPNTLGAWVKGNSNWGRLTFQVEDTKGNTYTSVSLGDWDVSDWRCRTRINFDGWKLITRGFPLSYASGHHGPDAHKWSRHDEIQYPVKVTRLYVILREKLVYVTDMVPAKSMSIELRDLTVGTDPTKLRRHQ